MAATQLTLDFPPAISMPQKAGNEPVWQEVTRLARPIGFGGACFVSVILMDTLDDQTLYDVLWTAWFCLSLDRSDLAVFTFEPDGKPVRFEATRQAQAVYIGRLSDF